MAEANVDTEVCIVGCGPVGLFLALLLHQAGVAVTVVDRQKARYPLPRAVALDHESSRMLGIVGISDAMERVLERVVRFDDNTKNYCWRDAEEKVIVDMGWTNANASGIDIVRGFSQPEFEGVLEETAIQRGIRIIRSQELAGISQCDDHAVANFHYWELPGTTSNDSSQKQGTLSITAKYLVGCDGANSAVRRLMEIEDEDLGFKYDWLITDFKIKDGYIPPRVQRLGAAQICDPARPTTVVFGGPGRKRLEFMRLDHESKKEMLCDEKVWSLANEWGYDRSNTELERKAMYTFQAKWAKEFFRGRAILAGDSAHLMPPFIGQGLNSGMRDATALAWRLVLVLRENMPPRPLLESYHKERTAHVQALTKHCILLGKVVCETDPDKAKTVHSELRNNPPTVSLPSFLREITHSQAGDGPSLGRPGLLTDQATSGRLSLQRLVRLDGHGPQLFDKAVGHGWMILTCSKDSIEDRLSPQNANFFTKRLHGRYVSLSSDQDFTGDYHHWFREVLKEEVVVVRPDFYIFGTSSLERVNGLVFDLRKRIRWAFVQLFVPLVDIDRVRKVTYRQQMFCLYSLIRSTPLFPLSSTGMMMHFWKKKMAENCKSV